MDDLIRHFSLDDSSQSFRLLPYVKDMDIHPCFSGSGQYPLFKLSWLSGLMKKADLDWRSELAANGFLRVDDVDGGRGFLTAVLSQESLIRLTEKVYGPLKVIRNRTAERFLEALMSMHTDRVLLLFETEPLHYTDLDEGALRDSLGNLLAQVKGSLPSGGFCEFSSACLKRGALLSLPDGRRAVAIHGFPRADEPVEPATPVQALLIDGSPMVPLSKRYFWVISDSGVLADRGKVKVHPSALCPPDTVDKLFVYSRCLSILDTNRDIESTFGFDDAVSLAAGLYRGITDRWGEPYLLHVFRVLGRMKTPAEHVCAVLHDVLEVRHDVTVNTLFREGVPLSVLRAIVAMTRNEGEDLAGYMRRIKRDPLATAVKKACLLDDMDLNRVKGKPSEADFERKYKLQKALTLLSVKDT